MAKDVSDFVGDCVSIFYGEHTQSLRFQQHFIHHRHRRVKGNMYIPSDRRVVSEFVRTLAFVIQKFLAGSWYIALADAQNNPSGQESRQRECQSLIMNSIIVLHCHHSMFFLT